MAFPRIQSGAALLAFMLIIVTGASFVLVSSLNSNMRQYTRQAETAGALQGARAALLAYSVTYPENHSSGGPGILPCPDLNNNGSASGNCSFPDTTLGRFPWKTVGVGEFRDHHGERLWYVVSNNFRTPQVTRINSDTSGTLQVENTDDIVAIIFAPGAPVGDQDRAADPLLAANYLEGGNEINDNSFVSRSADEFNDQLVYITRRDLMELVEKRVLGDVAQALSAYQSAGWNAVGSWPWLSPFSDPADSSFKSQPDVIQGHVPYHWSEDTPGSSNRNPFQTAISWLWHTDPGTATGFLSGTVTADCLRNVDCDDGLFPPIPTVDAPSVNCSWTEKNTVDCEPSGWVTMSAVTCNQGCPADGTCSRSYRVEFPEHTGTDILINDPDSTTVRTRAVERTGSLPVQSKAVEILDIYDGPTVSSSCLLNGSSVIGSGYINFTSNTTGIIETSRIQYDLDIDDNELSPWFTENGWHELVYVAYASGEGSPPGSTACTAAVDCIIVEGIGGTNDNKRAVVLIAGRELPGQERSVSPEVDDYFEGDNVSIDDQFRKNKAPDFNDQLRVLAEVAVP